MVTYLFLALCCCTSFCAGAFFMAIIAMGNIPSDHEGDQ